MLFRLFVQRNFNEREHTVTETRCEVMKYTVISIGVFGNFQHELKLVFICIHNSYMEIAVMNLLCIGRNFLSYYASTSIGKNPVRQMRPT